MIQIMDARLQRLLSVNSDGVCVCVCERERERQIRKYHSFVWALS